MKKEKWMFNFIMILILSFISCADEDAAPTTITVWTYYNGVAKLAFDSLVDEFNETVGKEENIIVNSYSTSSVNELADAVLAAANKDIGSQSMPNIVAAYSDNAYVLDQMGMVANLDPYFTENEIASYSMDFLADGRFGNNALKILPIAKSSEIIFVNKTDFDVFANETGANTDEFKTWEGIARLSKQYYDWTDSKTDILNDGQALFGIDSMANYMIIGAKQLGEDIFQITDEGIDITLSRKVAKKLWENFYIPFVNGYYINIGRFRSDDAKAGNLLAYVGSTVSVLYFPTQIETSKNTAYPIECMTFPTPVFEGGLPVAVQQGAGMVVIKSDALLQNAAIVFLKWFTDVDQNSTFAVKTGYLPVKSEILHIDSFCETSQELFGDNTNPVVISTANTIYSMLNSYNLYAPKPFLNNAEARKVLANSLLTFAKNDLAKIKTEISDKNTKEAVVAKYIVDDNFNKWYNLLIAELKKMVSKE